MAMLNMLAGQKIKIDEQDYGAGMNEPIEK